jgi:orotidine-5'-phosphate decarboxylase
MPPTFLQKLRSAQERNQSFLCIGLDPDPARLQGRPVPAFLQAIIEATSDLVCAYKPNLAFFEALGTGGMQTLLESLAMVPEGIPVIGDAKRGDIGNTAEFYARALFEQMDFDAVTVTPWGGEESVRPFADYVDRGVLVWCRGSNPSSADLQEQTLADGRRVFELVAELAQGWNRNGNIGLVAGATYPDDIAVVRRLAPQMPLLVPGVGAQAGDLEAAVRAAIDVEGGGIIINSSRQVLYASPGDDFAQAARRAAHDLRSQINRAREAGG